VLFRSYSSADIFVLPTLADSFPNALLEAMLHAKPVIGFRTGGLIDIIDDGETGFLVNQNDTLDLANKIRILYQDKNLCRIFGEKAYKKVKREYNIELKIQRYNQLYNELI